MGWALIIAVNEHKTEKCLTCLHRHTQITVQEQSHPFSLPYSATIPLVFWWHQAGYGQSAMDFTLVLKKFNTLMYIRLSACLSIYMQKKKSEEYILKC